VQQGKARRHERRPRSDPAGAGGRPESFRRLVERYQRPLLTLIRNLTPPGTDHEGVAQEVFLAAFRSLASFDPNRSAFSTWLFTFARGRCHNELARQRTGVGAEMPDVVDLRSPERAASEAEGEGAGRDVFRAGRQPEQFARQPHDRLRGPWRRARRRTVQVLASRDVDPVRRPDRISTDLIQNPQAAPPGGLRLDDLANLSWPVAARGERLGGGPVQHAWLTEVESLPGPSAANFATPHPGSGTTPRIFAACRAVRAYAPVSPDPVQPPSALPSCQSKLTKLLIGPKSAVFGTCLLRLGPVTRPAAGGMLNF
jgi:RNA polymerase sigma factor (sigma-70 family)